MFLQCYGEGHALRIAKTFGIGLNMTQRQLKRLEEDGVLVSRLVGNIRLFGFNSRNPTVRNLRELLEAELKLLPNDQGACSRRPASSPIGQWCSVIGGNHRNHQHRGTSGDHQ